MVLWGFPISGGFSGGKLPACTAVWAQCVNTSMALKDCECMHSHSFFLRLWSTKPEDPKIEAHADGAITWGSKGGLGSLAYSE